MQATFFLASPLDDAVSYSFLHTPKRWAPLINHDLYLNLILYKHTLYLAKRLEKFPLPIDIWQQTLAHVRSLLTQKFCYPSPPSVVFLACSHYRMISSEELLLKKCEL